MYVIFLNYFTDTLRELSIAKPSFGQLEKIETKCNTNLIQCTKSTTNV